MSTNDRVAALREQATKDPKGTWKEVEGVTGYSAYLSNLEEIGLLKVLMKHREITLVALPLFSYLVAYWSEVSYLRKFGFWEYPPAFSLQIATGSLLALVAVFGTYMVLLLTVGYFVSPWSPRPWSYVHRGARGGFLMYSSVCLVFGWSTPYLWLFPLWYLVPEVLVSFIPAVVSRVRHKTTLYTEYVIAAVKEMPWSDVNTADMAEGEDASKSMRELRESHDWLFKVLAAAPFLLLISLTTSYLPSGRKDFMRVTDLGPWLILRAYDNECFLIKVDKDLTVTGWMVQSRPELSSKGLEPVRLSRTPKFKEDLVGGLPPTAEKPVSGGSSNTQAPAQEGPANKDSGASDFQKAQKDEPRTSEPQDADRA